MCAYTVHTWSLEVNLQGLNLDGQTWLQVPLTIKLPHSLLTLLHVSISKQIITGNPLAFLFP